MLHHTYQNALAEPVISKSIDGVSPHVFHLARNMGLSLDNEQRFLAERSIKTPAFQEMLFHFLERSNVRFERTEDREKILRRALTASDFPHVLRDTMSHIILKAYRAAPATFQAWTVPQPVPDAQSYTFNSWAVGEFKEGHEGNEAPTLALADKGFSGKIRSFSGIASITHEALSDGRIGNLRTGGTRLGIAARATALKLAYSVLLSNPNITSGKLFHADNGNLVTDATSALGEADLTLAAQALRSQKDAAGNTLNLSPAYLLAPPSLETAARKLCKSLYHEQPTKFDKPIQPVIEPLLEDDSITGSSSDDWYLIADPSEAACFGEVTLDGEPLTINQKLEYKRDVVSWAAWLRINFVPISTIGMVKVQP